MKKFSILIVILLLLVSCKSNSDSKALESIDAEEYVEQELEAGIKAGHYRAFGNEPFWMVDVNDSISLFTLLNNKIDSVFLERDTTIIAKDKIEIFFKTTNNEQIKLMLNKSKNQYSDGMSDNLFEYSATFLYHEKEFKGCAENVLDVEP